MFIKFYKSNQLHVLLSLVLTVLLFRIDLIFKPSAIYSNLEFAPIYNFIYRTIVNYRYLVLFLNIVLITAQVLLLNNIIAEHNIAAKNSYLVGFIYLTLLSVAPSLTILNPTIFANILLIFALASIFKIYGQEEYQVLLFNASFLIAIASLFYFPSILFVVFLYFSLLVYREFSIRSFFIPIIGIIVPYLYLFTYYLWTGNLQLVVKQLLFAFNLNYIKILLSNYAIFGTIIIGIIGGFSTFNYWTKVNEKLVKIRKYFNVLIWFLISALLGVVFSKGFLNVHFSILAIPLSVFIANFLYLSKNKWISNLVVFIFIILVIISKIK